MSHAAVTAPAVSADPETVAAAVAACPHVVGLRSAPASGVGAEVATYRPGGRVEGVRVSGSVVAVRVVGAFGQNLTEFADEVRTAVRTAAPSSTTVDVFIDDLLVADDLLTPDDLVTPDDAATHGAASTLTGRTRTPSQ